MKRGGRGGIRGTEREEGEGGRGIEYKRGRGKERRRE